MPRRAATTSTAGTTRILRTSLRPKLYRDIEIESTDSLYSLALAITQAFGFFSRLTGRVFASPIRYELFADDEIGGASRSVRDTAVADAFPRLGSKMLFLFDYGDEWRFRVEVVGHGDAAAGTAHPRVVASVGKAPEQYPDPEEG